MVRLFAFKISSKVYFSVRTLARSLNVNCTKIMRYVLKLFTICSKKKKKMCSYRISWIIWINLTVKINVLSNVNIPQAVNLTLLCCNCIDSWVSLTFKFSSSVTLRSLWTHIPVFRLSRDAAELTITIAKTDAKWTAIWYEKKRTNSNVLKCSPVLALPNRAPRI